MIRRCNLDNCVRQSFYSFYSVVYMNLKPVSVLTSLVKYSNNKRKVYFCLEKIVKHSGIDIYTTLFQSFSFIETARKFISLAQGEDINVIFIETRLNHDN